MGSELNLSACGLNCSKCDFFLAGKGDKDKQREIIQWFKNDYDKEITPEQTMCRGCMGPSDSHWSPDCVIRKCAIDKKVTSCYMCGDFICEKLDKFANDGHKSHRAALERLKEIKKNMET